MLRLFMANSITESREEVIELCKKLNYSASIRRNRRLVPAVHSLRSILVAFCICNFKRVFKNNANPLSFVGISNCIIKFAPSV